MTFPTWHEPVRLLEESTGPATDQQRELASTVGLALAGTEPRGVAAVLLEEYLQPLIWGEESERATDRQRAFLVELGSGVADDADLTKRTASAWIQHHLALRSIENLRHLALVRDDAVIKRTRWRHPKTERLCETLDYAVVSSIGANGMVYFRGGNGGCGWPSSLTRAPARTRRNDYPKLRALSDDSTR
jgi:hypothetical protein